MTDDWQQDEKRREKAARIDTNVPNFARVGDYLYGGRNNFEADRKAAHALVEAAPVLATIGPAMRAFHRRVLRYLVTEAGVRQFLDIGTGLAVSGNTHQVVQELNPCCRVVYVDNDPMVLAHARALMKSAPGGATSFIDADYRDPAAIIAGAAQTLDLSEPVAVLLLVTLVHIPDTDAAAAIVAALAGAGPAGSHVAISHMASDLEPSLKAAEQRGRRWPSLTITLRSREEVASLVAGLDPVPPGLVPITDWHPAPDDPDSGPAPLHGVVARKP